MNDINALISRLDVHANGPSIFNTLAREAAAALRTTLATSISAPRQTTNRSPNPNCKMVIGGDIRTQCQPGCCATRNKFGTDEECQPNISTDSEALDLIAAVVGTSADYQACTPDKEPAAFKVQQEAIQSLHQYIANLENLPTELAKCRDKTLNEVATSFIEKANHYDRQPFDELKRADECRRAADLVLALKDKKNESSTPSVTRNSETDKSDGSTEANTLLPFVPLTNILEDYRKGVKFVLQYHGRQIEVLSIEHQRPGVIKVGINGLPVLLQDDGSYDTIAKTPIWLARAAQVPEMNTAATGVEEFKK